MSKDDCLPLYQECDNNFWCFEILDTAIKLKPKSRCFSRKTDKTSKFNVNTLKLQINI